MPNDATSRRRWAFRLLFLVLVVVPLVTQWVAAGANVVGSLDLGAFGTLFDRATVVRAVGCGVVVVVALLLVRQKRRSRGQQVEEGASEGTPEQRTKGSAGREVEGSGEVYAPYAYNNQQAARRESERIRNRAEEIAEAERDAYERR